MKAEPLEGDQLTTPALGVSRLADARRPRNNRLAVVLHDLQEIAWSVRAIRPKDLGASSSEISWCLFCEEEVDQDGGGHEDSCAWVVACELLKADLNAVLELAMALDYGPLLATRLNVEHTVEDGIITVTNSDDFIRMVRDGERP